jgi:hypothetical protein
MYTEQGIAANVVRAVVGDWASKHNIDADHLEAGELTLPEIARACVALTPEVVFA